MKFFHVQQGSAEWYERRMGRPSASMFHKIVTPKGEPSKQAVKYLYRLVAERLLHETMDDQIGYVQWVEWGKTNEANAVAQFNFANEVELEPGGLVTTDDGRLVASPDRTLRNLSEGVEVKCPAPWTQVEYLLDGPGDDYRPQVQGQLLVGEFRAVHFYTWHPQMPPLHKVTVPEPNYQRTLLAALHAFCDALDVMTERARMLGAYAVVRPIVRPQDRAFGDEADAPPLTIINPEGGEIGPLS
jgi:hypothetical protein